MSTTLLTDCVMPRVTNLKKAVGEVGDDHIIYIVGFKIPVERRSLSSTAGPLLARQL